jgi:hypothetical protein
VHVLGADIPSGQHPRAWTGQNGYQVSFMQAYRLREEAGYSSIVMSRDPYDRVSAFVNKLVMYRGKPLRVFDNLEPFRAASLRCIARRERCRRRQVIRQSLFREFVSHCFSAVRNRGNGEPDLNNHWNTQVPFRFHDAGFEYSRVIRIEQSDVFCVLE